MKLRLMIEGVDVSAGTNGLAHVGDADEIVVHDRYHRTRVFRRKPAGPATSVSPGGRD